MKLNSMTFGDDGEMPDTVTVTLTLKEVIWVTGKAGDCERIAGSIYWWPDCFNGWSGDGDPVDSVTVTLTVREALWIAQTAGKSKPTTAESHSIYDCLSCRVFNAYWDDGVRDAEDELKDG